MRIPPEVSSLFIKSSVSLSGEVSDKNVPFVELARELSIKKKGSLSLPTARSNPLIRNAGPLGHCGFSHFIFIPDTLPC